MRDSTARTVCILLECILVSICDCRITEATLYYHEYNFVYVGVFAIAVVLFLSHYQIYLLQLSTHQ